MSSQSMAAIFEIYLELTAEEFRLLALISESSAEHDEWLIVDWGKVLKQAPLSPSQCGRLLRGLQSDGLIIVGAHNLPLQMSAADFRCPFPLEPGVYIRISKGS